MTNTPIDYFKPEATEEEVILRRIKGDYRKGFIAEMIRQDGLDSIPPQWLAHSLCELFKQVLIHRNPIRRGGEDLPDLQEGEVEIARVSMADSVHGEVTSLRGKQGKTGIALRVVDECKTKFELPRKRIATAFTACKLIEFLAECEPSPLEYDCKLRIASPFYRDLQVLVDDLRKNAGSETEDDD